MFDAPVRDAAERLRRVAAGEPFPAVYPAPADGEPAEAAPRVKADMAAEAAPRVKADMAAVAAAVLAAARPDDDEPADPAWWAAELGVPPDALQDALGAGWDELVVSAALRTRAETVWAFTRGRKTVRVPFARVTRGLGRRLLAVLRAGGGPAAGAA